MATDVLLATQQSDLAADYLCLALRRRRVNFARWNIDTFPDQTTVSFDVDGRGVLRLPNRSIRLESVRGAWFRRFPQLSRSVPLTNVEYGAAESVRALENLFAVSQWRWVNAPESVKAASLKMNQLKRAKALGLRVPATVIGNAIEEVAAFASGRKVIVKPVEGSIFVLNDILVSVFTEPTSVDEITDESMRGGPSCFQERIDANADVRVTVVGGEVFATVIKREDRTHPDWRLSKDADLEYAAFALDPTTADICVELVRSYGLRYAAIDFLARDMDDLVFLEVNPSGQWAWIEEATGQRITDRLIDVLLEE
jgi:glutathione synthase/RimK-type ligase-like ATP-grasp enzyme